MENVEVSIVHSSLPSTIPIVYVHYINCIYAQLTTHNQACV